MGAMDTATPTKKDTTLRRQSGNDRKPRKRIGDVLVELGYATEEQVEEALKAKSDSRLRLGTRLVRAGVIDEVQLADALSARLGVGFTALEHLSEIDTDAVSVVPERLARRYVLIPVKSEDDALTVAMSSPGNVFAIDAVQSATGKKVKVLAAPAKAIRNAIERFYGFGQDLESSVSELASIEIAKEEEVDSSQLDPIEAKNEAEDAPVVKYVDSLISHAVRDRASDIHIEPGRKSVSVRIRVDGRLRSTSAPPKNMQNAVISRIKILANLDIAEKRLPLDGRIRIKCSGRDVDLRVSTLPGIHGEKVVLSVLDKSAVNMELGALGADPAFLDHLKAILGRPSGMILVTGPTGSGKTTTLYGALNFVRNVTKNIVSVEDPVEYEIEGVTQVAARPEIDMTFARALRAILRQDPDVVMVGEMRDLETLEIGMRASLTGHLVLSTLHTNDAVSTITRLIDMGAERYLIASTLVTTIGQRLLRCICPECREEHELADALRRDLAERLETDVPSALWRGRGCTVCGGTGYYGRTGVYEHFHLDAAARDCLASDGIGQSLVSG